MPAMTSCFHSVGLPKIPILQVLERVRDAGYTALELNAETLPWAAAHVTPATPPDERRALAEAARRAGISIPAVGAHIPMVDPDPASRANAVAFVKGCSQLASDVGAPIVHILSGPLAAGSDRRAAWRWFADAVTETTVHAEALGVTLAIEAIAGHMFRGFDDYVALRRDLPGVPFRINFDPSHLIVQGEDPRRIVTEMGDQIVHVHMKDGAGRFPDFTFPPLGQGDIDFAGLLRELDAAGYRGALSVEYEAQVYGFKEGEDEILRHGRIFLRELGV